MKRVHVLLAGVFLAAAAQAQDAAKAPAAAPGLPRTAATAGAELYFIAPADGATVGKEFTVRFGLKGMGVAPAGVTTDKTGHHHLLIDVAELPPMNLPLPNDATHKHFGGGQTETTLTLTPGQHTLQLVLGDALHIPFDPPILSKKITITVK
ncbi:uncharacterized protein DUF4399 [Tahibacter aquaticus]|uniref:Uncharacterized protein DUF4399 n=1 Tax=Tahibacter aquaticus TaxID=520092 RepID=A0A4R6YWG7_9GAMM|nr:DUF4399 domain-containing protein [Tahibacter aquaticus]TDR43017.1 uncharacterized protein DUF4399 [Tahibacter aquaticus]